MMKRAFLVIITIAFSISPAALLAQSGEVNPDSLQLSFRPYGSFRGHLAFYNGEMEFQENGSRVGFEFSVKKRNTRFFVASELQMNMFKSDATFNASANLAGGFLVAEKGQERQVFGTRLGYLGIDLNKYGTFSVGKQWSVYYDVTSYTDKFNVFGGQGSATYVAGTDGGGIGTGRADQAIVYRNQFGPLMVGAQAQARTVFNGKYFDGYGLSAQVKILKGLKAGVAFNKGFVNEDLINSHEFLGLKDQPTYFTVGANYTGDKLELGAVYANQTNGDLTQGLVYDSTQGALTPSVVFNAHGLELYGKYKFGKFAVLAGYNNYSPDVKDIVTATGQKPVSPDFKRNYVILGMEYRPINTAYFYAEQRFANGKTALGTDEFDVLTLGIRIDVERMLTKTIKR